MGTGHRGTRCPRQTRHHERSTRNPRNASGYHRPRRRRRSPSRRDVHGGRADRLRGDPHSANPLRPEPVRHPEPGQRQRRGHDNLAEQRRTQRGIGQHPGRCDPICVADHVRCRGNVQRDSHGPWQLPLPLHAALLSNRCERSASEYECDGRSVHCRRRARAGPDC